MNEHEKINYVEFPSKDIEVTKAFFATVFGWSFQELFEKQFNNLFIDDDGRT